MKKRILSFVSVMLLCIILFSLTPTLIFAEDTDTAEENNDNSPFYNITCVYDAQTDKIKIEYRMNSAAVKKYEKLGVSVYSVSSDIALGELDLSKLEPIVTDIVPSNRSVTEFIVADLGDRLSGYVLAIKTLSGDYISSEIFYPQINGYSIKAGFKGIKTSDRDTALYSNADSIILEIDCARLESGRSGYLFKSGGKTYTFSGEYVDSIDELMRLYCGMGADVIIRILPKNNFTSIAELQSTVYAYVSFIYSRYSSEEYGISGIILGDNSFTSAVTPESYSHIMYSAALAINDLGGECGLSVPVSENYTHSTDFLESLCKTPEMSSGLMFTVTVESTVNPYGLTDGSTTPVKNGKGIISTDNYSAFRLFIQKLRERYGNVYINTIYYFKPDSTHSDEVLNSSYIYGYLSLFFDERVGMYIIDTDGMPQSLIDSIRYINSKNIDSKIDLKNIGTVFGISDWTEEFANYSKDKISSVDIKELDAMIFLGQTVTGSYPYFDFSSSSSTSDWIKGSGCDGISTGKNSLGKALVGRFPSNRTGSKFILHGYKYTESFKYTDFIEIGLMLESAVSEYSVSVNIGGDGFLYTYNSPMLEAGKKEDIYIDVTGFTENQKVEYISIEIKRSDEAASDDKLYLYSVNAISKTYDSEELTGLIESERERLRDSAEKAEQKNTNHIKAIIFIAVIVFVTVAVMIMISRKQKDEITEEKK